jgi:hypothetical protein
MDPQISQRFSTGKNLALSGWPEAAIFIERSISKTEFKVSAVILQEDANHETSTPTPPDVKR